jgi:acylphosphatase
MSEAICRNLRIRGRVQGVGYRWSLCAEAQRLGLSRLGTQPLATAASRRSCGDPLEAVDALLVWAHHGPSMARVDSVVSNEGNAAEIGTRDRVRADCLALTAANVACLAMPRDPFPKPPRLICKDEYHSTSRNPSSLTPSRPLLELLARTGDACQRLPARTLPTRRWRGRTLVGVGRDSGLALGAEIAGLRGFPTFAGPGLELPATPAACGSGCAATTAGKSCIAHATSNRR